MIIQHNISAINSYNKLATNQTYLNKNLEKLSSGYRINRGADDAAGLAISEGMRGKIRGLKQATTNAQDAVGFIQTADGALSEMHSMFNRMTTLATEAANGTYNSVARSSIQDEVYELADEIDRIANSTNFNGFKPLNATENGAGEESSAGNTERQYTFQIGPTQDETMTATGHDMTVAGIFAHLRGSGTLETYQGDDTQAADSMNHEKAVNGYLYLSEKSDDEVTYNANRVITNVNKAIDYISSFRADLGAVQNRLEHAINVNNITNENLTSAESRIRDTDMAEEIASFTKNNVLKQAAQSMLAQANQAPQGVLSLLQ